MSYDDKLTVLATEIRGKQNLLRLKFDLLHFNPEFAGSLPVFLCQSILFLLWKSEQSLDYILKHCLIPASSIFRAIS